MQIFNFNFVGISGDRTDITLGPLAFLTPHEDNAAGAKRRESVRQWLNGYSWQEKTHTETRIIPNTPKTGFRVVDVATRYMTSNKFARIFDPDGFELEISIDNLVDLMLYTVVDHGEIMGELVWGRDGGHNRLIPVDSDLYRNALREGQTLVADIGDVVIGNHGKKYVYLGLGYIQPIAACGSESSTYDKSDHNLRAHYYGEYFIRPEFVVTCTAAGAAEHVYLELSDYQDVIVTRKSRMKLTAILGKYDKPLDSDTMYHSERCWWHSADGLFLTKDVEDLDQANEHTLKEQQYRYLARNVMFRTEPFTLSDTDSEKILADILAQA